MTLRPRITSKISGLRDSHRCDISGDLARWAECCAKSHTLRACREYSGAPAQPEYRNTAAMGLEPPISP